MQDQPGEPWLFHAWKYCASSLNASNGGALGAEPYLGQDGCSADTYVGAFILAKTQLPTSAATFQTAIDLCRRRLPPTNPGYFTDDISPLFGIQPLYLLLASQPATIRSEQITLNRNVKSDNALLPRTHVARLGRGQGSSVRSLPVLAAACAARGKARCSSLLGSQCDLRCRWSWR